MPIRDEAINVFMGLPGRRRAARADLQPRRRLLRARHRLQPHRGHHRRPRRQAGQPQGTGHRAREAPVHGRRGRLSDLLRARPRRVPYRADRTLNAQAPRNSHRRVGDRRRRLRQRLLRQRRRPAERRARLPAEDLAGCDRHRHEPERRPVEGARLDRQQVLVRGPDRGFAQAVAEEAGARLRQGPQAAARQPGGDRGARPPEPPGQRQRLHRGAEGEGQGQAREPAQAEQGSEGRRQLERRHPLPPDRRRRDRSGRRRRDRRRHQGPPDPGPPAARRQRPSQRRPDQQLARRPAVGLAAEGLRRRPATAEPEPGHGGRPQDQVGGRAQDARPHRFGGRATGSSSTST